MLSQVKVSPESIEKFRPVIGEEAMDRLIELGRSAAAILDGRTVWNLNSTAAGGGVAEMLQTLLAYGRGLGIDTRWLVSSGDAGFFLITKRIHNGIHGSPGDGGPLGPEEHAHYKKICEESAAYFASLVKPGDVVILHDPQTAGIVDRILTEDVIVIWRCHIGLDIRNDVANQTWDFLRPYLENVHAFVFSRRQYAPDWIDENRLTVISPSIDPFSSKNYDMDEEMTRSILAYAGIIDSGNPETPPMFIRTDGTEGRIENRAEILREGPPPTSTTPLVCQISRWDRLKDMEGVMKGFAYYVDHDGHGAHLVLAGPSVTGVADDPEQTRTYEDTVAAWRELPDSIRKRIQLVCLPMHDIEENAAIVNALQRQASIIIQKSLQEGFGLTVSEAMWKSAPLIGSAVGGILDQIEHDINGLLIQDPHNLEEFGTAVTRLLEDASRAKTMGREARERVRKNFLASRHLEQFGALLVSLVDIPD